MTLRGPLTATTRGISESLMFVIHFTNNCVIYSKIGIYVIGHFIWTLLSLHDRHKFTGQAGNLRYRNTQSISLRPALLEPNKA